MTRRSGFDWSIESETGTKTENWKPGEPAGWANSKVSKLLQINKNANCKYNSQNSIAYIKASFQIALHFNVHFTKWR